MIVHSRELLVALRAFVSGLDSAELEDFRIFARLGPNFEAIFV